jgi:hypothetical protein
MKEVDSIRAAAAEAAETVVLTREFYSCVVKDNRTASGQFRAVKAPPVPFVAMTLEEADKPGSGF